MVKRNMIVPVMGRGRNGDFSINNTEVWALDDIVEIEINSSKSNKTSPIKFIGKPEYLMAFLDDLRSDVITLVEQQKNKKTRGILRRLIHSDAAPTLIGLDEEMDKMIESHLSKEK